MLLNVELLSQSISVLRSTDAARVDHGRRVARLSLEVDAVLDVGERILELVARETHESQHCPLQKKFVPEISHRDVIMARTCVKLPLSDCFYLTSRPYEGKQT